MQYAQLVMPIPLGESPTAGGERIGSNPISTKFDDMDTGERWEIAALHLFRSRDLQPDLCDVDFQIAQYYLHKVFRIVWGRFSILSISPYSE